MVANSSDTNFDGCVGMFDLLDLLSSIGTCVEVSWACGDPLENQGYDYETVQIGEHCWFTENLRSENCENGDTILGDMYSEAWQKRPWVPHQFTTTMPRSHPSMVSTTIATRSAEFVPRSVLFVRPWR